MRGRSGRKRGKGFQGDQPRRRMSTRVSQARAATQSVRRVLVEVLCAEMAFRTEVNAQATSQWRASVSPHFSPLSGRVRFRTPLSRTGNRTPDAGLGPCCGWQCTHIRIADTP